MKTFKNLMEEVFPQHIEEADTNFEVEVEGLPKMFLQAKSISAVKANLRKLMKKPDSILNVTRVTPAVVKKTFRDRAQGKEDLDEAIEYNVGDKVKTLVGGKWLDAVITKPAHPKSGNYGVKFKVGTKTVNYVSSQAQLQKA